MVPSLIADHGSHYFIISFAGKPNVEIVKSKVNVSKSVVDSSTQTLHATGRSIQVHDAWASICKVRDS